MDLSKYDLLNTFIEVYHMKKGDFFWWTGSSADITNSSPKSLEFTISQSEIQKKKPEDHCYSPWAPKITYKITPRQECQSLYIFTFTHLLLCEKLNYTFSQWEIFI